MRTFLPLAFLAALSSSCTVTPRGDEGATAFEPVRVLLETNCVHCHGDNHLPEMPAITDTKALARLIGTGKWIIPGKPAESRFFQVATFPDNVWGAMPPTGHAISGAEVKSLRAWIQSGAKLPAVNIPLKPRGDLPRSQ